MRFLSDREERRSLWIFVGMAYAVLPLIALQIYLDSQDDTVWQLAIGLAVIACFIGIFLWAHRHGLFEPKWFLLSFAAAALLAGAVIVLKAAGGWPSVPLFVAAAGLLTKRIGRAWRDGRRAREQRASRV